MQALMQFPLRVSLLGGAMIALSACENPGFDFDMRHLANGFSTTQAVSEQLSADRPTPDARGILSYPTYQVALAQRGDTITDLANRIGLPPEELARYNALPLDAGLRTGELIALPRRVAETASGPILPNTGAFSSPEVIDITSLAGNALDRADASAPAPAPITSSALTSDSQSGEEPARYQVERGETAYSIARAFGVSVRSLSKWNGLGTGLNVREGQYLLIPVAAPVQPAAAAPTAPGQGTPTPTPPSAATPLPAAIAETGAAAAPASPDLASGATAASAAQMVMPVDGQIIRTFKSGTTDGIDISASAGTPVKAADAGTVAAITRDTDQVPILVIRHAGNLLTVYANIDNITVSKGDSVARGQKVAEVREGNPAFLHFQVREGTQSVDPAGYLD